MLTTVTETTEKLSTPHDNSQPKRSTCR